MTTLLVACAWSCAGAALAQTFKPAVPANPGQPPPALPQAASGGTPAREEITLTLATGTQADSRDGRWLRAVFGEAFRRLGWQLSVVEMPARRAELALQRGEIDGEMVRTTLYGEQHPELQRVDAALMHLTFALYGTGQGPQPRNLDAMVQAGGQVIFRRGVSVCEQRLREVLPAGRLVEISAADSAVRMLARGRARFLCDMDSSLSVSLAHLDPGQGMPTLQRLFDLGPPMAASPYLHARHVALAPRLAAVLQQMRSEGRWTPETHRPAIER